MREHLGKRGRSKDTTFTKKTSTSLPPSDTRMWFFGCSSDRQPNNARVGVVFDMKACHLKGEKYTYPENACTNNRRYLAHTDLPKKQWAVGIDRLRVINEKNVQQRNKGSQKISKHNEILAGLSKDALRAVFATQDTLFNRLNALEKRKIISTQLDCLVPVLVIYPKNYPNAIRIYEQEEQILDQVHAICTIQCLPISKIIQQLHGNALNVEDKVLTMVSEQLDAPQLNQVLKILFDQSKWQLLDNFFNKCSTINPDLLRQAINLAPKAVTFNFLNQAVEANKINVVSQLCQFGANVLWHPDRRISLLSIALKRRRDTVAEILIKKGHCHLDPKQLIGALKILQRARKGNLVALMTQLHPELAQQSSLKEGSKNSSSRKQLRPANVAMSAPAVSGRKHPRHNSFFAYPRPAKAQKKAYSHHPATNHSARPR